MPLVIIVFLAVNFHCLFYLFNGVPVKIYTSVIKCFVLSFILPKKLKPYVLNGIMTGKEMKRKTLTPT